VDKLLSLPRLAARLRLPREWIEKEAVAGRLPCLRIGKRLFFNPDAVERALAKLAAEDRGVTRG
jgi:hypothetical protein